MTMLEGSPVMTDGNDIVLRISTISGSIGDLHSLRTPEKPINAERLKELEGQKSAEIVSLLQTRREHSGSLQGLRIIMHGEPLDFADVEPYTQRYLDLRGQLQDRGTLIFHTHLFRLARATQDPQQTPEDIARLLGNVDEIVPETPTEACLRLYDEIKAITVDRSTAIDLRSVGYPKAEKRVQRLDGIRSKRIIALLDLGKHHPALGIKITGNPLDSFSVRVPLGHNGMANFSGTRAKSRHSELWNKLPEYF